MDRAKAVCSEIKKAGINHVVWIPDSETHFMHDAMLSDPELKVIQVCREGEAIAICAGLHIGGKRGAVLVENQGIFETGNVLKWAAGLNLPMLLLVGYLGYRQTHSTSAMPSMSFTKGLGGEYTEPFFDAFGISHYMVTSDEDVKKLAPACEEAWQTGKPVAVLLSSADGFVPGI